MVFVRAKIALKSKATTFAESISVPPAVPPFLPSLSWRQQSSVKLASVCPRGEVETEN